MFGEGGGGSSEENATQQLLREAMMSTDRPPTSILEARCCGEGDSGFTECRGHFFQARNGSEAPPHQPPS